MWGSSWVNVRQPFQIVPHTWNRDEYQREESGEADSEVEMQPFPTGSKHIHNESLVENGDGQNQEGGSENAGHGIPYFFQGLRKCTVRFHRMQR